MNAYASDSGDDTVDRALIRFIEAHERGEHVDVEDYCRDFGPRADELRRNIEDYLGVDSVVKSPQRPEETVRVSGATWADPNWGRYVSQLRSRGPAYQRYSFLGEIGRGGMGAVLRVFDNDAKRVLAMKVIKGQGVGPVRGSTPIVDSRKLGRFLEEAQITAQLDHPSIVPVHEVGVDDEGRVYFTMKLVKGQTLRELLDEDAALHSIPLTRFVGILHQICEAVHYAHDKGVIHRDLKPENVMVGSYGETYVMDWGLAGLLDRTYDADSAQAGSSYDRVRTERSSDDSSTHGTPHLTHSGDVMGTPCYMSPEQAQAKHDQVDARSDVYAVGAMLYRVLAGRRPYETTDPKAGDISIVRRVATEAPQPVRELNPQAQPELVAICEKAMRRDRDQRYPSMRELADDFRAWLDGRSVAAFETSPWFVLRKWAGRNKAVAVLSGLLGIATMAVPGVYFSQQTARATERARLESAASAERQAAADARVSEAEAKAELEKQERQKLEEDRERELANQEERDRQTQAQAQAEADQKARLLALSEALREMEGLRTKIPARLGWGIAALSEIRAWLKAVDKIVTQRESWSEWRKSLDRRGIQSEFDREEGEQLSAAMNSIENLLILRDGNAGEESAYVILLRRRLETLVAIERVSLIDGATAWTGAIDRVAKDPRYSGIGIEPQFGFVPLGEDPGSGLEEFAHAATGEIPGRDSSGMLVTSPHVAAVFVLLPPGDVYLGAQSFDSSGINYDASAQPEEFSVRRLRCGPIMAMKLEITQWQFSNLKRLVWHSEGVDSASSPQTSETFDAANHVLEFVGLRIPTRSEWEYCARIVDGERTSPSVLLGFDSDPWEWCGDESDPWIAGGFALGGGTRRSTEIRRPPGDASKIVGFRAVKFIANADG